jgi:CubicO group peptidase (beta-lactamase class C family)
MMASVSKTITWTALTMLMDQGKFKLDDAIDSALPFKVRNPTHSGVPITYRHLYAHTSSMKDAFDSYLYGADCPRDKPYTKSLAASLEAHVKQAAMWGTQAPGKRMVYSNFATALGALLVERHSGMEFAAFTQRYIFDPLTMSRTTWVRDSATAANTYTYKVRSGSTTKYDTRFGGYCYADYPSGQLYSTATDMAKFSAAMLTYGRFSKDGCLYSEATGRLAFQRLSPAVGDGDSALGWFAGAPLYKGGVGHDGAEEGVASNLFVKTSAGIAVGWMANSELSDNEYDQLTAKLVAVANTIGRSTALPSLGGTCTPVLSQGSGIPATTKPATDKPPAPAATTDTPPSTCSSLSGKGKYKKCKAAGCSFDTKTKVCTTATFTPATPTTPSGTGQCSDHSGAGKYKHCMAAGCSFGKNKTCACADKQTDWCSRKLASPQALKKKCARKHVQNKCAQTCGTCTE